MELNDERSGSGLDDGLEVLWVFLLRKQQQEQKHQSHSEVEYIAESQWDRGSDQF
jgi:hypothetical protein